MEIILGDSFENKLLYRKEVKFEAKYDGATPKRAETRDAVAKKLVAKPDYVVLHDMHSVYGSKAIYGKAYVYSDAEQLKKVEREYRLKRYTRGESSGKEEKKG